MKPKIVQRVDTHDTKFNTHDAKFNTHDVKFLQVDSQIQNIDGQLANKANKSEVDTAISNIGNASPKGVYSTLTALQTAFPSGTTGIYVVTANGNWYYWNGTAWTVGGVYQSTGIADKSIVPGKLGFIVDDVATTVQKIEYTVAHPNVMTIKLSDSGVGKNSFYRYSVTGEYLGFISLNVNEATFVMPNWSCLVWDLTANSVRVVNDSTARGANMILLLQNTHGKFINGFLAKFFWATRTEIASFMQPLMTIDIENKNSFYHSNYNNTLFFKWEGNITICGRYQNRVKTFNQLLTDLGSYYKVDSPQWVKDCCRLDKGSYIGYNFETDKFVVNSLGNQTINNSFVLIENQGGYYGGILANLVNGQVEQYSEFTNNHIKPYYKSNVETKENEVVTLQNDDTFTFAFGADFHINEYDSGVPAHSLNVLNKVVDSIEVDAIVNGGDTINYGRQEKYHGFASIKNLNRKIKNKVKTFHVVGNHEYNGVSLLSDGKQRKSWTITKQELYNLIGKQQENNVVWGSKEGMYYYKDFADKKIRAIFLNTSDNAFEFKNDNDGKGDYLAIDPMVVCGLRSQQVTWLINTALNFTDKQDRNQWHTMVFTHIPIFRATDGMTWNQPNLQNDVAIRQILNSFRQGTSTPISYTDNAHNGYFSLSLNTNFAPQGALPLIGVFSGHVHIDRIVTDVHGLTNVSVMAGYPDYTISQVDSHIQRTPLTYNEIAFDVIVVNKQSRRVDLKRFGAGTDRFYTY